MCSEKNQNNFEYHYRTIQSVILTKKRVKKKRWKHQKSWWFLSLIALLTASFIMKIEQIVLFIGCFFFLNVLENGLRNSCTKNQVTAMVSFVKTKLLTISKKSLKKLKESLKRKQGFRKSLTKHLKHNGSVKESFLVCRLVALK